MIQMPEIGVALPWITIPTTREALMPLNGLAGHSVILGCAGPDIDPAELIDTLENAADFLAQHDAYWLVIVTKTMDSTPLPRLRNPRARLIPDTEGTVRRALRFPDIHDGILSVGTDAGLRVVTTVHHRGPAALRDAEAWATDAAATAPGDQAGSDAPVLLIPNVIEASLRRELITAWDEQGHEDSGYLRPNEDGSVTHVVNSGRKRRSDHFLADSDPLAAKVHSRIRDRVAPWIERAMHFKIGFAERYRIACYETETAGFFAPHRDFSEASAHRHFAMSIALNDGYQGGALRFPEFGSREYVLSPGQAVVYSGSLLHEVTPMTDGRRFALVNFLTNEDGARKVAKYQRDHGTELEHKTVG
jgi:predicted 2-oxoglutarate/Fe(II)-dependent dioxygenase YbiX